MCLLQLGHDHAPELIQSEHAHEDVDASSQLIHAVRLDTHVVGPQVPADLRKVLFVILWGNLHHSRVAGRGVVNPKELPHVVNQREGLEMLRGHLVDSRQEYLVKGLVVR